LLCFLFSCCRPTNCRSAAATAGTLPEPVAGNLPSSRGLECLASGRGI
jgi:hypothetical protein